MARARARARTARRKRESGLMSSAGLMRYYEAEETAIKLSPKTVVWTTIFVAILVMVLNIYYGKFPA
jgi:preprotein translocase subunit Sec61beta